MTDEELLKTAAKAAGIELRLGKEWHDKDEPQALFDNGWWRSWNPLADDGDALRLAVKLGMSAEVLMTRMEPFTRVGAVEEEHRADPYAATRRAIVRAAATMANV